MTNILKKHGFLLAGFLCVSLIICPFGNASPSPNTAAVASLRTQSQVKSEAAAYDAAMQDIARINTMKLDSTDNLKTALGIFTKQAPNLKFRNSKLLAIGLADSGFVNSAKARVHDTSSAESFARELAKDRNAVFTLAGASSVANRMARSVDADSAVMSRFAERMKQASDDLKQKSKANHARVITEAGANSEPKGLSEAQANVLTVVVVALVCSPLLPVVVSIGADVVALAILGRLISNIATDEGRDKVKECFDQAEAEFHSCLNTAHALPFPVDLAAEALCAAEFALKGDLCPFAE